MTSSLEETLALQIRALRLPEPQREYRFAAHHVGGPGKGLRQRLQANGLRDWRADFAWPVHKLLVEVEGATPAGGRHQRYRGFLQDAEKYHAAQSLGWTVYRCTGPLIRRGEAVGMIESLLGVDKQK